MKTLTKTVQMKSGDSFYYVQKDDAPGILSECAINEEIARCWLEEIQAEEPEAYIVKTVLFRGGEFTVHVPAF